MEATNLLFIMSDEHSRKVLGCYGHATVKTPHMDGLSDRGTRFANAYTNCPICVPARASFATGRYIHETGYWDGAHPYEGAIPSWGHRLMAAGHRVVSIGKLHYRNAADPNGFDEEIIPMHARGGVGDLDQLLRDEVSPRPSSPQLASQVGAGETSYTAYDREITKRAVRWLEAEAPKHQARPWVLFVSFVCPHYPLTAPQAFYDLYPLDELPMPKLYGPQERPDHPAIRDYRTANNDDDYFDDDSLRKAIAGYFGLVSFIDDGIGRILGTLAETGLAETTRVIYTSDHGENLGARGLWGKSVMYEESAGVPLIMAGPGIAEGARCETLVSLVDCYPTILEAVGEADAARADERALPGHSLFAIAEGAEPERTVFSEYHALSSTTGHLMVRNGRYKYVYYPGYPPQLFDLEADPEELDDLGESAKSADARAAMEARLRAICDPDAVDARAKGDQQAKIAAFGGEEAIRKGVWGGAVPVPGGFETEP